MSDEFYILSPKHSRGDWLTWWAPGDAGYRNNITNAGRYTREEVLAHLDYYNNGDGALAIPCEAAEAVAVLCVDAARNVRDKLTEAGRAALTKAQPHNQGEE